MIDRSLIRLDGMRKLIFDLLDLTRIESGQKQRNFCTVDIRASAQAAIDLFTAEATARHIGIAPTHRPVEFEADPNEIEIILNNLVSRREVHRDGGSLTVSICARRGQFASP